jgi:chromosome segregation ATPase
MDVQEHFNSDISVLLQDKLHLQEKLESTNLRVQQIENELHLTKQKIQNDKDKYEDLAIKFNEKSNYIEQLINDKNKFESLNEEYQKQIQSLQQDLNQYSDLNLILSNQQMNISYLNEELNNSKDLIKNIENILPLNQSTNLFERIQQLINDHENISQQTINDKTQIEQLNQDIPILKLNLSNQNQQQYSGLI